jgi:GWxTD domain-containing protein
VLRLPLSPVALVCGLLAFAGGLRAQPLAAGAGRAAEPEALVAALDGLRRTTSESKAFSAADGRRYALARRLLAADAASALAHEELALRALLEFDWRCQMARRGGRWDPEAERGMSGAANRARERAERHLAAALAAEPDRAGAHRLALRLALVAGDSLAFARAAGMILTARPEDPDALLSAARAAYVAGDLRAAEAFVEGARPLLAHADRRDLDDPSSFYGGEERAAAGGDATGAAERAWRLRDPLLLTPQNERRLEHAARLSAADLLFGDPVRGVRGWRTRRGEVFLRYGPPDYDRAWTESNHLAKVFGAMHQWVYGGADGFTLTFDDSFRSGDYDFASSAYGEDDATRARGLFNTQPERYALRPAGGTIPLEALVSTFRGADGATDLVVALGVPLDDAAPEAGTLGLETGAFLLDPDSEVAAESRQRVAAAEPGALTTVGAGVRWVGAYTLAAPPGAYTLAAEALQPATERAGALRQALDLPGFEGDGLRVSDLLLAEHVEDDGAAGPGVVRRNGFAIRPLARAAFPADQPLYVYAEAYGVTARAGRAAYEIEVALTPQDRAGALRRLTRRALGRRAPGGVAVRAAAERSAAAGVASVDDAQYVVLDARGRPPGAYTLTVRVRDLAVLE